MGWESFVYFYVVGYLEGFEEVDYVVCSGVVEPISYVIVHKRLRVVLVLLFSSFFRGVYAFYTDTGNCSGRDCCGMGVYGKCKCKCKWGLPMKSNGSHDINARLAMFVFSELSEFPRTERSLIVC